MAYDVKELLALPTNDKKELIAELMDSILVQEKVELPTWKKELYQERLDYLKANPNDGTPWSELRKKYFPQ
jgi:putative addiction module component (TIGR02574 family)